MRRFAPSYLLALVPFTLLLTMAACRGSVPSIPEGPRALDANTPLDFGAYAAGDHGAGALGRYQLIVDGDQVEVVPARLAQGTIGQHLNVDITDALTGLFCADCLKATSVRRSGELIEVDLEIRHPFAPADDLAPPSSLNRRDLWVSTVKGVLLLDSTQQFFDGQVQLEPSILTNADGYTKLINVAPGTLNADTFPYKVFGASGADLGRGNFDGGVGWELDPNNPTGYLVWSNAEVATATYRLKLGEFVTASFDMIVTCAFQISGGSPANRLTPIYYMPSAAAPEPWKVLVNPLGTLEAGNDTSATTLRFQALDWQQDPGLSVDAAFPDPANRNGLAVSSDILAIDFSLPAITGEPITFVPLTSATGNGLAASPYTVDYTLMNSTAVTEGTYVGVAKFLDERDPLSTEGPYKNTIFVGSDLATPYTPPAEFATYAVFRVEVTAVSNCLPLTPVISGDSPVYTRPAALYEVVRTLSEYTTIMQGLIVGPIPLPPIDWATHSVAIACTGFTDDGVGQRTAEITDVCPNASLGNTITVRRGDPTGGCPVTGAATAPFDVVSFPSTTPENLFIENPYDTCLPSGCEPLNWTLADKSDAAPNGYDGGPIFTFATSLTDFLTTVAPLYGANPVPIIDFDLSFAVIVCTGATTTGGPDRWVDVVDICRNVDDNSITVTTVAGEFLSCSPPPISPATAPFVIAVVDLPVTSVNFDSTEFDVCGPPPLCDNPMAYSILVQADVRTHGPDDEYTARHSDAGTFATDWARFFPEIAPPVIDWQVDDAFIIASAKTLGSGSRRIVVESMCLDPIGQTVETTYTMHEPLGPGCAVDDLPTHLVTVLVATRIELFATTAVFTRNSANICDQPSCAGGAPTILDEGDAAATWLTAGTDLVLDNQAMFDEVWKALNGPGNPPSVDFDTDYVLVTTSGFHPMGVNNYNTAIVDNCPFGNSASMTVAEGLPVTCPPPLPVATTPFVIATAPRFDPGGGGILGAHSFPRREVDTCDPGQNCTPEPGFTIDQGDYPNNTTPEPITIPLGSQQDLDDAWASFFSAGNAPPQPSIDFDSTDAIFLTSGFTTTMQTQRSISVGSLCVDIEGEYVMVDQIHEEPLSCPPLMLATHPWCVALLPKGASAWTIEQTITEIDSCQPGLCAEYTEIAASALSTWTRPEGQYELIVDADLDDRKQHYRDVWADLGPGDPPGIDELGDMDAVVVLIHGGRSSGIGSWDISMTSYCLEFGPIGLDLVIGVQREGPIGGCPVPQVPTSPYRIYTAPILFPTATFVETEIDTCR